MVHAYIDVRKASRIITGLILLLFVTFDKGLAFQPTLRPICVTTDGEASSVVIESDLESPNINRVLKIGKGLETEFHDASIYAVFDDGVLWLLSSEGNMFMADSSMTMLNPIEYHSPSPEKLKNALTFDKNGDSFVFEMESGILAVRNLEVRETQLSRLALLLEDARQSGVELNGSALVQAQVQPMHPKFLDNENVIGATSYGLHLVNIEDGRTSPIFNTSTIHECQFVGLLSQSALVHSNHYYIVAMYEDHDRVLKFEIKDGIPLLVGWEVIQVPNYHVIGITPGHSGGELTLVMYSQGRIQEYIIIPYEFT